jgi:hypothetical protein
MLNRKKLSCTIADMGCIVSEACFLILIQNTISKNMDIQKNIGMQFSHSLFPSNMSLSAQVELAKGLTPDEFSEQRIDQSIFIVKITSGLIIYHQYSHIHYLSTTFTFSC